MIGQRKKWVQGMTTNPLSVFLHLAAEAYRKTEVPEALDVANRIIAHAAVPVGQRPKPAIFSHLAEALAAKDAHPAIATLVDMIEDLPWIETSFGATAYLIGSGVHNPFDSMWFGLMLQKPETFYRSHSHAPEELYFVLSGTAEWQRGIGAPFAPKPPGSLIVHRSNEAHAMLTNTAPLLAMWTWFGDLDWDSYELLE